MVNKNELRKLWDIISVEFDVGTFQEFLSKMQINQQSLDFYNVIKDDYDIGNYDTYESRLSGSQSVVDDTSDCPKGIISKGAGDDPWIYSKVSETKYCAKKGDDGSWIIAKGKALESIKNNIEFVGSPQQPSETEPANPIKEKFKKIYTCLVDQPGVIFKEIFNKSIGEKEPVVIVRSGENFIYHYESGALLELDQTGKVIRKGTFNCEK